MSNKKFQVRSAHVVAFVFAFVLTAVELGVLRYSSDNQPKFQATYLEQGVELAQNGRPTRTRAV